MSAASSVARGEARGTLAAAAADYAVLMKARVTSLVMMAAGCGYYMGAAKSTSTSHWGLFHAVLGIGLVSGGAAALNQVMERDVDALMLRTAMRPLPMGRMSPRRAAAVGICTIVIGVLYLGFATNWLAALLAALTASAYAGAYTPLKRHSTLCTFVGAFPGAMPPLLGWVAARGTLGWEPVALFAVVFAWQFPHFHSIAWLYREDYRRARIQMLAATDESGRATLLQIIGYGMALVPISMAPAWMNMAGRTYAIGACLLSAAFLYFGLRLASQHMPPQEPRSKVFARRVLQASVFYLPLLFALLMLDSSK
ncbi:MAG: protoheme IX farnesyltransferase [Acidobacteria bacterium]|nr:protoheme IX farnesyltransferase [Acidobacteriota bacterium]